jgi:hypothetical protein
MKKNNITVRFVILLFSICIISIAQISNVRQTIENGRIVINYSLRGAPNEIFDIYITANDGQNHYITPQTITGDILETNPEQLKTIWWEPQLEGLPLAGWTITLFAKINYTAKLGIKWVLIQGGPRGDYFISATEVTFDQYDAFCESTGLMKPRAEYGRGKQPVVNVNLSDALSFCVWLKEKSGTTVRLPEEDEWEFAAQGGNKCTGHSYSGSDKIDDVAWYNANSGNSTHEVATKKPNELGIYDMSGNVWEWCGTSGVFRGGAWYNIENSCKIYSKIGGDLSKRNNACGFRLLQKK